MGEYVGLDVSQEATSVCFVDETGRTLYERKVATAPDAIAALVRERAPTLRRIGLETGPLSVWLWNDQKAMGLPAVCLDARHAKAGLSMMVKKTDRNDAAGLAQIVRAGWYREVHVKSAGSHVVRAVMSARTHLVRMRGDLANQVRGLLKTFGIIIGKPVGGFAKRAAEVVALIDAEQPTLAGALRALLAAREDLCRRIGEFDRQLLGLARKDETCRRFMTAPGVGAIVALSVRAAIDDPQRFARSASVGAYLGPTPRRYASGEIDRSGRISRCGDKAARTHLFEAANVILTRRSDDIPLRRWGLAVARRSGLKKAKVAAARKLAGILHRMWRDGTEFRWEVTTAAV